MTGGHRRILVVEDDPETAGQIVDSLTTSGYQVDLAASGNEALSRGVASDYAVITIDRMLPDIDGIAVMRQLRDDGIAAPVLIISALGEVDDRVRIAGARRGAWPTQRYHCQGDHLAGRRSRDRSGVEDRQPARQAYFSFSPGIPAAGVSGSQRKPRGIPGHVAAARLGSSFRSFNQYHRRLCRTRASQGRRPASLSADPYGSGYRVLPPCSWLRP